VNGFDRRAFLAGSIGLDAAVAFAGERRSRSVVLVTDGRIVADAQWQGADPSHERDIASCQKSVVAVLAAVASERGLLDPASPVSEILGSGWTRTDDPVAEGLITVAHLLSMTSGLAGDLRVVAPPGTTWLYDNDAYHRLHAVLEAVAGEDLEDLTRAWLWDPIGVRGARWVERPGSARTSVDATGRRLKGLVMNAYDLARFALLVQRAGRWGGRTVVTSDSVAAMLRPSSELNPSYGRLWWLNGQDSHRRPGPEPPSRPGPLFPAAPADLVAALGANDQKTYVVGSFDSVLTRLGDRAVGVPGADGAPLPAMTGFDDDWWVRLTGARTP
jgi:CubicO group peptidase (beta-lactamase class C family)